MASGASGEGARTDVTGAWLACLAVAVVTGGALAFTYVLRAGPEARMISVFLWFQRAHEPVPLMVTLGFVGALMIALVRGRSATAHARATTLFAGGSDVSLRASWLLGIGVTLVAFAITHAVMHGYALTGDEWSATFQSRIFARGMLAAPVAPEWQPWARVMLPPYIRYDATAGTWESMYLPMGAAIRSLFVRVGAESLTNPVLAGLTVVGLAGVARRLWPGEGRMQWLALGALVTSAQFLLMSGTAYAMPAHLCLNTWWLWCWLRREDSEWYVAALTVIGVAALGLHQPFPHALFVVPFLIRMVGERRWARTMAVVAVYAAGSLLWIALMRRAGAETTYGVLDIFGVPKLTLATQNFALVASWQAPLVAVCATCGLLQARTASPVVRDLALGILLTTGFYALFRLDQQHGWGYRYVYAVLANLTLVSAWGARWLASQLRAVDARLLGVMSVVLAVAMLLPFRARQAEAFVRPFASAAAMISASDSDVVLIPAKAVWYGIDLVRNAPFAAHGPHVMNEARPFPTIGVPELPLGSRVRRMSPEELLRLGIPYRDMSIARPQLQ